MNKKLFSMKRMMMVAASLCCALLMGVFTVSCDKEAEGDFFYTITPADGTSNGLYSSYRASGAERIVLQHVAAVGELASDKSTTYIVNGKASECTSLVINAVNRGMDQVESAANYNQTFVLSNLELTVRLSDKVIYSRKFK